MLAPLLAASTAAFVVLLLIAESRAQSRRALVVKSCASLSFVALGIAQTGGSDGPFARWLLAGLVCAAIGDVLLALPGERAFQAGVGAFWLGHLAYVMAARSALGAAELPGLVWLVSVPSALAYAWLFKHLGAMRVPVAGYIVVISLMVVYAIGLFAARPASALWFMLGALLFYASDLAVAQDRFVKPGFLPKLWGLPAYYAGQVSIAWSVGALG